MEFLNKTVVSLQCALVIFACLFSMNSKAQEFAPTGAIWHYNQITPNPNQQSYTTIESTGDSLIDGVDCKKLLQTNHFNNEQKVFYAYSDSNKVYFYEADSEVFCLLYDFNAELNDTFTLDCFSSLQVVVSAIDSIDINGNVLKMQYYEAPSLAADFTGWVIQNIGHQRAFFPTPDQGATQYAAAPLRCYDDTLIGKYFNTEYYVGDNWDKQNCEQVIFTSIEETPEISAIKSFPNPVRDIWNVELAEASIVQLYSTSGKTVFAKELQAGNTSLNLSQLAEGIYFYSFYAKDSNNKSKVLGSGKIVKD